MKYDFLDTDVLSRLGAIPLDARQPMIGNVAGRHRSPHRGSSVEFAEYRKYVQGDDTRRLDWKAYGRSDRFYIKEFEADTNLRCFSLVDSSASMAFQSDENPSKLSYAQSLAATLSYLVVDQGDAAALSCSAEKTFIDIPPARRASHLQNIFETLNNLEAKGETGLIESMNILAERAGTRALTVIISDFFTDTEELADALQHLRYRKHDVAVFHLLDPQELDFKFNRPHRFVDLEDGTAIVAEPNLIADEYHSALATFLKEVETACFDANAGYTLVRTDTPYEDVLRDFLTTRLK